MKLKIAAGIALWLGVSGVVNAASCSKPTNNDIRISTYRGYTTNGPKQSAFVVDYSPSYFNLCSGKLTYNMDVKVIVHPKSTWRNWFNKFNVTPTTAHNEYYIIGLFRDNGATALSRKESQLTITTTFYYSGKQVAQRVFKSSGPDYLGRSMNMY